MAELERPPAIPIEESPEYADGLQALAADAEAIPIRWAKPRDYTVPFLLDRRRYVFAIGGKRSSKSWTNVLLACVGLTGEDMVFCPGVLDLFREMRKSNIANGKPPFRVRHWCPDLTKVAKKVLLPIYRRFIPREMVADTREKIPGYNEIEHTYSLKDGSYVEFFSYKMDKVDRESAELDLVVFDEPPAYDLFLSQMARVATTGGTIRGAMTLDERSTSTYDIRWIDRKFRRGKGGPDYGYHYFPTEENIKAVAAETGGERGEAILDGLAAWRRNVTAEEAAISIDGLGGWCSGLVYPMFDEDTHSYGKLAPKELVELARGGYGEIWGTLDFGTNHPTAASWFYRAKAAIPDAEIAEGDLIKVAEYKRAHPYYQVHIAAIKELDQEFGPVQAFFSCPFMFAKAGPDHLPGVASRFIEAGLPLRKANNRDELEGIADVIARLYARVGGAPWPGYRVCRGACPQTVDEFQTFSWKPEAERAPTGADLIVDANNDLLDGDRYLVKHIGLYDRSDETMARQAYGTPPAVDPATGFPLDAIFAGMGFVEGGL